MATDLSTMFQYAPGMAGFFTGQQQGSQMQTEDATRAELAQKIQELQIKNQFDQQNNPQLLDQQRLRNRGLEEGLPEITARAQQEQVKARLAQNTEQTATAAGNAENQQKLTKAQYEQAVEKQKLLYTGAQVVQGVEPPLRAQALSQHLSNGGIDVSNPQMQKWIADNANNPAGLTKQAQDFGDLLTSLDPQANASVQGHKIAAKASNYSADQTLAGHKITAGATVQAARIAADSRVKAAEARAKKSASDVWEAVLSGKLKPELAPMMLLKQASQAEVTGNTEDSDALKQAASQLSTFLMSVRNQAKPGNIDPSAATNLPPAPAAPNPYAGGAKAPAASSASAPVTRKLSNGTTVQIYQDK